MYPSAITVNMYKSADFATSANHSYAPVFECVPVSLDINTTFPTPKDEGYYLFEGSPQSSNDGQITPLSPCSMTDQQNLTFIYNNNPVVTEMSAPDSSALSNHKLPLVTHYASNNVIKDDNQQQQPFVSSKYTNMAPNIYSNEELIHQPANVKAYPINKTVSQKPICKEEQVDNEQVTISSKKEGVFTPTNFNHMSREQLIARLLVLENDKSSSNSSLKVQQPPIATRCLWKDCNKNFDTLKRLISHITELHVGSGKPSYRCEWEGCPRREYPFTKRHKMQNHLRTHTGERPFICKKPDCKKRFSRLDSLTTHLKTHSNIRPFVCIESGCGKAYYHSRSLKKHEKIHQMTITASSPTKKIMLDPPAMSLPSTSNRMSQHRQPFIPYSGFMYGEKMSLVVDNSNYNPFVLNTGLTNQ